jgi:hypothetical protein
MKILGITFCLLPSFVNCFFYHNYRYNSIPLNIITKNKSHKEMIGLNYIESMELIDKWYQYNIQNIHYKTEHIKNNMNKDILNYDLFMNNYLDSNLNKITNVKYKIEHPADYSSKFLIWKPKIKKNIYKELEMNNVIVPLYKETLTFVDYDIVNGTKIYVNNLITSPLYSDKNDEIYKTCEIKLKEYFIKFLKYRNIYI